MRVDWRSEADEGEEMDPDGAKAWWRGHWIAWRGKG